MTKRKKPTVEDRIERAYIEGGRMVHRLMLGMILRDLNSDGLKEDPIAEIARLRMQLEDTRRALRSVCEKHGDNDWSDNLHLADVVTKHLEPYLDDR